MSHLSQEPPNRLPWPPILYMAALAVSWVLQTCAPLPVAHVPVFVRALGAALISIGLVFDLGAMLALYRSQTTILPNRAASHLVTSWPFSVSRNPIYLGNSLALMGLSLLVAWPWLAALTVVTVVLVKKLSIEREERHLERVFGSSWLVYRTNTPRWIWRF